MGTFSWLGGDISNAFHWVSGGSAGTEPGPTDTAIFSAGGAVTGAANVGTANFSGAYVFSGATLLAGTETLSAGGSIVQKDGINAIVSAGNSLVLNGESYTLSGGTLSAPQAAEFLSGTFKQFSGTNTAGGISIAGTYTFAGGTLSVVSGVDGLELVGAFGSSGGFIQSGGTHTVAQALAIGTQVSGSYVLTKGLLSMPVSGPSHDSGNGEYIGQGNGGVGTFIQNGGTNSVAHRHRHDQPLWRCQRQRHLYPRRVGRPPSQHAVRRL